MRDDRPDLERRDGFYSTIRETECRLTLGLRYEKSGHGSVRRCHDGGRKSAWGHKRLRESPQRHRYDNYTDHRSWSKKSGKAWRILPHSTKPQKEVSEEDDISHLRGGRNNQAAGDQRHDSAN